MSKLLDKNHTINYMLEASTCDPSNVSKCILIKSEIAYQNLEACNESASKILEDLIDLESLGLTISCKGLYDKSYANNSLVTNKILK